MLPEDIGITRNMGCTKQDLLRWLPNALGDLYVLTDIEIDQEKFQEIKDAAMKLCATSSESHQIALLVIPTIKVQFLFSQSKIGLSKINEVMDRFDLYTRRGGG